jgi:hypothetical protein
MVVRIAGKRMYLWRAVDHEGEVLDSGRRGNGRAVPFHDAPAMGVASDGERDGCTLVSRSSIARTLASG